MSENGTITLGPGTYTFSEETTFGLLGIPIRGMTFHHPASQSSDDTPTVEVIDCLIANTDDNLEPKWEPDDLPTIALAPPAETDHE